MYINIIADPAETVPTKANVGIGTWHDKYPDLVQIPLMPLELQLFASKEYLKSYGFSTTEEDLHQHYIVSYEGNTHYSSPKNHDLALS